MLWSLCWVLAEIIQPLALVQICKKKKSQVKQKKKFFIMMNDHSKISFNSRHFASATELLLSPAQKQTNKQTKKKDLTVILDKTTLSPIMNFGCAAERK